MKNTFTPMVLVTTQTIPQPVSPHTTSSPDATPNNQNTPNLFQNPHNGKELFTNRGGTERNNLNNFVKHYLDNDEQETFPSSLYHDLNAIIEELQPFKNDFIAISLNIESLNAKIDKLRELIEIFHAKNIDISAIMLQETWLHESTDKAHLIIDGYHEPIHQGWICGRKGGLTTYIHENFNKPTKRVNIYKQSQDWEALIVDVKSESFHRKITICNFYRPPRNNYNNPSLDRFLKPLEPIVKKLCKENSFLLMCGDSNINLLRLDTWTKCQEYFDLLVAQNLFPSITLPTRFSKHKATLIDHMFCREKTGMNVIKSGIILTKISDHLPCLSVISTKKNQRKTPKFIEVKANNEVAIANFKSDLRNTIANTQFSNDLFSNPNDNYNRLHSVLMTCKEKNLPTKKVRFNRHKHKIAPWMTYGILESINKKDSMLAKLYKTNPRSSSYALLDDKLKMYSKVLQTLTRKAKISFYTQDFNKRKDSIKDTWNGINKLLNRKGKDNEFPTHLIVDGKILKEDQDIANNFNDFFTNIGPILARDIKTPANKSYKDYLKEKITSNFNFHTVSTDYVKKVLGKLKSKSSSGHDGISSLLLKEINDIIAEVTTLIINQSLSTGIFPDKLKLAKVVPVFKKDNPHQLGNYRPISLLPAISKIFEKVVYTQVYEYLNEYNLLYKSQYGFRKKHSCELAAMEVTDKIFNNLDKKKLPLAVFIDLSKAFDTIDHQILLHKLEHYGIRGTALKWFKSYLTDRQQYVQYKDKTSEKSDIITGVPQGSILGPLLFIIYVNDIAKITNKFHFTIYADDTTLIEPICTFSHPSAENIITLTKEINLELDKIVQWMALNKLSLNVKKTKMMIFHYKQKSTKNLTPKLKINNAIIEKVKEFKFLGITIDEHMSWKAHSQKVACKIGHVIGTMKRLKKFLPTQILRTLYNSLVLPHLTYGIILWGKHLKRINKLQKWAIRTVINGKYNSHTEPILKKLKLLKVSDIYKLTAIKIFHKYKNDELPEYFDNFFETHTHRYNTRKQNKRRATPSTVTASQSPRFSIPTIVDSFPEHVTAKLQNNSLKSTSNYVKKYLIDSYIDSCQIANCYICNRDW